MNLAWWQFALIGPSVAGALIGVGAAVGFAGYKLGRYVKRRLTWLFGTPRKYPYIDNGIREAEAFANTSAICPCGCQQFIMRVREGQ